MANLSISRAVRVFASVLSPKNRPNPRFRIPIESLESRLLLSVNITSYDNVNITTGVNSQETALTPSNVNINSFGKQYSVSLDGQVYAEPLVETGVAIGSGPNTTAGASGVHNVVYVATENDSIYAIDTTSGAILWHRTFVNLSAGAAGTDINNPLGASSVTTVPSTDVDSDDLTPEIGITGTPVIDSTNNRMYVIVATKETIGGVANWVQFLHAINLSNGTDVVAPYLIAATPSTGADDTNIYVYGTGDGAVTDPYNGTGKQVVQFDGLRENQRAGLSLVNGVVFAEWSSHGDQGNYHGWVVAWNVNNLSTSGFVLKGVFNDTPNGGEGGIWEGAGQPVFTNNGNTLYFESGNGTEATGVYNSAGFPTDGNYGQSVVELVTDTTTSPTNQNINGWGFKVADFFTPFNAVYFNDNDIDFSSGTAMVPSNIPGVPEVLLAGVKSGTVYVLNPNNLGKFDPNNDHVLNAVPNGSGNNAAPVVISPGGSWSTAAYFDGNIYWVAGGDGTEYDFTLNSDASFTVNSTASESDLGYLPGSTFISANGTANGIDWQIDRNANVLRAFSTGNLGTELWDSGQNPDDALDSTVKFAMPTVANGQVFVGTQDSLTVFGLVQTSKITAANAAVITGYSYDPTDPSTPNSIEVVIAGGPGAAQTILADLPSPELTARLGTTSNDFSYAMPVLSVGAHTVWIYSITAGNVKTLLATETITSQNSLFDENYYLATNPDVAAAVADGEFATGYDHYIKYGQFEGRSPSPYWDEAYYLQENPDVAAAVKAGTISSGFMHYYLYGQFENRPGLLYFNTTYYLQHNPDVAAAVRAGTVSSAFEQFVLYGQYEGRSPMKYFSSAVYDADNQDILPFITGETFSSDFEQFVEYGQYENRIASNFYNEQIYLTDNPDVAAAVMAGEFPDGFQHWLEYGQFEGRTAV
jgi:hypothetical protein